MSVLGWADERRKKEEKLKEERSELEKKEKLRQKEITEKLNSISLYHFTDVRNLDSIREIGLYGWLALENHMNYVKDVDYFPAVDENNVSRALDSRYRHDVNGDLKNYVRLSSHKKHWMAENAHTRGLEITFLVISNKIFTDLNCLFSDMNTNKTASTVSKHPEVFLQSNDKHAEVLVHRHIPVKYILRKEGF
jgi:hypothetical protein